jgi:hypothetical protein
MKNTRRRPRPKGDNFLLLRFIAASMVIYGHAPAITGHAEPVDLFIRLNWGTYSGSHRRRCVLHRQRLSRDRQLRAQPAARRFHLGPGHPHRAGVRGLPAAVRVRLGAAFTELPLRDYFQHPDTLGYVVRNLKFDIGDAVATARRVRGQPEERCRQRLDLDLAGRSADVSCWSRHSDWPARCRGARCSTSSR